MTTLFLHFNLLLKLFWLADEDDNTVELVDASTPVRELRIVAAPRRTDDYMFEYEIEQKGIGWRCVGTVSDCDGTLGMVEREYYYQRTTLMDILGDMHNLLLSASETAIRG